MEAAGEKIFGLNTHTVQIQTVKVSSLRAQVKDQKCSEKFSDKNREKNKYKTQVKTLCVPSNY